MDFSRDVGFNTSLAAGGLLAGGAAGALTRTRVPATDAVRWAAPQIFGKWNRAGMGAMYGVTAVGAAAYTVAALRNQVPSPVEILRKTGPEPDGARDVLAGAMLGAPAGLLVGGILLRLRHNDGRSAFRLAALAGAVAGALIATNHAPPAASSGATASARGGG